MLKERRASYFGFMPQSTSVVGGGEVKTKTVLKALLESGRFDYIAPVDTSDWRHHIISLVFRLIIEMIRSKYIIIVQSTSAFSNILPTVLFVSRITGNEIHFIPVGNCLTSNFDKKSKIKNINRIKGVYVQSETIKEKLDEIGVQVVHVMHNFKYMESLYLPYGSGHPLRFAYLSRISREKGIFECIEVFNRVNNENGKIVCTLDIYGKIDSEIAEEFKKLVKESVGITYCGIVPPEDAAKTLVNYYMMVFPTKYEGEGFPGAVIDAFAGGVPLLVSRFGNFSDMLKDGWNCISFQFNDYDDMYTRLLYCIDHYDEVNSLRINAHNNYSQYMPNKEIFRILDNM